MSNVRHFWYTLTQILRFLFIQNSNLDNFEGVMGNFNLKDIDWESVLSLTKGNSSYSYRFIECIRDCYFTQHILENTRQRGGDTPSCLDLVFSNDENIIKDIEYLAPLGKSDHCVLKFNVDLKISPFPPKISVQYEKGDYNRIKDT